MQRVSWASRTRWCVVFCAIVALTGCATWSEPAPTPATDSAAWQARQAGLQDFSNWTLNGRIASTGLFGFSGRVRWQQAGEGFVIDVAGPFGAGATRLSGDADQVEIRNAEGAWVTDDAEGVLRQAFGWSLPLAGLRQWAIGLPIADQPARIVLNPEGQLLTLEQAGWIVTYEQYTPTPGGPVLPQKLLISNDETRWRLLVDRWQLPGQLQR